MSNETIKELIAQAMATRTSSHEAWRIDFQDNELKISHNGCHCATFVIESYEKGHLIYHNVCPKAERVVLDRITLYMQGVAI